MKYLKKFNSHAEYAEYMVGDPIYPNVSYCEAEDDVHITPLPASSNSRDDNSL